ncbi:SF1B family DNA helicase RecD2 [Allocoleopsis franciscana]|uniref:ATP-dependent RecD2 DNA helicase n=1 Tax=Allocoleopsis franciscana PCC 7113 TaxID=1173027 RepID=K9WRM6_9CYAN|nr:ATP-dependent RecD-like DNA helicase [Allocoleopsis franciscana]AFZ22197.1 helicase, putative, RecD/TraA family [Allocoleopsis franciscana PCC 7113]
MSTNSTPQLESLEGIVERITFHSDESGYTVARFKVPRTPDLVTIIGNFAQIEAGQTLKLSGIWRDHPKFGQQFQVTQYRETKPATLTGMEKYLGSGLIKGVGPVTAKRIVAHFGLETLDVIENQIERLLEVPGIAHKRVKMIQSAWEKQKAIKEVMVFLQGHGVSTTYAVKIFKQYGDAAIAKVTENPYQLAADIYGIGFVTADTLARNLGIEPGSEFRYRAGIVHVLGEAAEDGHCFLPFEELVEQTVKRLAIDDHQPQKNAIARLIQQMGQLNELVLESSPDQLLCYKPSFFQTEQNLAQRLRQQLTSPVTVDLPRVRRWLLRFREKTGIELSEQQQQAVEIAASERVLVLTGGPGCGKTFTTRTIVALWKAMGFSIALAAPTGRAAQRLSEMTGQPASTLHRLLEFDPKTFGFKHDESNPMEADAIVVDEASMLDLFLAYSLMKAVKPEAQLLLVGDIDQLPSVGPGNVLRDLIVSQCVPVARLTQVFRQAQASQIVTNAHQINLGKYPQLESVSLTPRSDCLWLGAPEPDYGVQGIMELLTDVIPQLGFNPTTDVQVLSPSTRGVVGTRNLNQVLQNLLNPPSASKAEVVRGGTILRVGDRLIQRVNDYQREVFNGDLGVIVAIDNEEQEIRVQFDQRQVTYDYADLLEVDLAWAVTIHKSQGSEYPVVVLPLFPQHYLMLSRNLLYTGLTRAKRLAVIVGPKKAVAMAVNQVKDQKRYTGLAWRLSGKVLR